MTEVASRENRFIVSFPVVSPQSLTTKCVFATIGGRFFLVVNLRASKYHQGPLNPCGPPVTLNENILLDVQISPHPATGVRTGRWMSQAEASQRERPRVSVASGWFIRLCYLNTPPFTCLKVTCFHGHVARPVHTHGRAAWLVQVLHVFLQTEGEGAAVFLAC